MTINFLNLDAMKHKNCHLHDLFWNVTHTLYRIAYKMSKTASLFKLKYATHSFPGRMLSNNEFVFYFWNYVTIENRHL